MRHGGQLLIDQLAQEGCDTAFCVPGESYLAALDGLYGSNDIRTIICRQEGGAAMMAAAHGEKPGNPASPLSPADRVPRMRPSACISPGRTRCR